MRAKGRRIARYWAVQYHEERKGKRRGRHKKSIEKKIGAVFGAAVRLLLVAAGYCGSARILRGAASRASQDATHPGGRGG